MIYNKLLSFKYSTRKTNEKETKKTNCGCRRSKGLSKLRNIKRAMKYTQLQLLLLVKNNYIQKSDW